MFFMMIIVIPCYTLNEISDGVQVKYYLICLHFAALSKQTVKRYETTLPSLRFSLIEAIENALPFEVSRHNCTVFLPICALFGE
jgi:hypothetical protein